jgi:uncharacterized membrane protein
MAVLDTPAEHYLDTLVQLTQDLAQVDTVLISLIDRDRQWFKARVGLDVARPRATSPSAAMPSSAPKHWWWPMPASPRFVDNPLVLGPPFIRFYAGQPLHAGNGPAHRHPVPARPRPRQPGGQGQLRFRQLATLAKGYLQLRALSQRNQDLRQEVDREQRRALLDPLTSCGTVRHCAASEREARLALNRACAWGDLRRPGSLQAHQRQPRPCRRRQRALRKRPAPARLRPDDLLVRQGGEEFVALLRVQDERGLQQIAERMRTAIGGQPMQTAQGALTVTLAWAAAWLARRKRLEQPLARADAALYERNGRAATACTTVKRRRTERGAHTPEARRNKEPPTWLQPWLPTCTSSRCLLMFALLVLEHRLFQLPLDHARARSLVLVDLAYGASAGVVLLSGIARALWFARAGLLPAQRRLPRPGRALRAGRAAVALPDHDLPQLAQHAEGRRRAQVSARQGRLLIVVIRAELTAMLILPLLASLMAHGIGMLGG